MEELEFLFETVGEVRLDTLVPGSACSMQTLTFARGMVLIVTPEAGSKEYELDEMLYEQLLSDMCMVYNMPWLYDNEGSDWEMTLTDHAGRTLTRRGDFQTKGMLVDVSESIRELFGRKDLLLVDGNCDHVVSLELLYSRSVENLDGSSVDTGERIMIDRDSETVTVQRSVDGSVEAECRYHIGDKVAEFLEDISPDDLSHVAGNPENAKRKVGDRRDYMIRMKTVHGRQREVRGSFDRDGLPSDWPDFADYFRAFLYDHAVVGELMNPVLYNQRLRRQGEKTFCQVLLSSHLSAKMGELDRMAAAGAELPADSEMFDESEGVWCIAQEDRYSVGEVVVIMTDGNEIDMGEIIRIRYCRKGGPSNSGQGQVLGRPEEIMKDGE